MYAQVPMPSHSQPARVCTSSPHHCDGLVQRREYPGCLRCQAYAQVPMPSHNQPAHGCTSSPHLCDGTKRHESVQIMITQVETLRWHLSVLAPLAVFCGRNDQWSAGEVSNVIWQW